MESVVLLWRGTDCCFLFGGGVGGVGGWGLVVFVVDLWNNLEKV